MDKDVAKILLKSLLGRLERDSETQRCRLNGVLSDDEVVALEVALAALGEVTRPIGRTGLTTDPASTAIMPPISSPAASPQSIVESAQSQPTTPVAVPQGAATHVVTSCSQPSATRNPARDVEKLAAHRRVQKPRPQTIMCLDFGTARSKAFATDYSFSDQANHLDLGLGRLANEEDSIYAVTSSVWIEDDGLIFVGRQAVTKSLRPDAVQTRFDSLKQELSQGDMNHPPETTKVPSKYNPSEVVLTYGHLITYYLAFLTDLAETSLETLWESTRYVARSFALPSWDDERRRWGEELLRRYLARAQIVADVFRGRWMAGVPAAEVKVVVDAVARLPDADLPFQLSARGSWSRLQRGASRLRTDGSRGLVMVIDVGAGTTDFALFVTTEDLKTETVRAFQVEGGVRTLRQAGDIVDSILRNMMLYRIGARAGDPEFDRINAELLRTIRSSKERLFNRGIVHFNDGADSIQLEEFLKSEGVQRFTASLRSTFEQILTSVHRSFIDGLHDGGLKVVLTGGGAALPMVTELAQGTISVRGCSIKRTQAPLVPDAFLTHHLKEEYPQLAVAIGGASSDMPELRKPLSEFLGSRASSVVLDKY